MPAVVVVVMGVSGCGKSTVGRLLAEKMKCDFLEGDVLHPASNIAKMSSGVPLTDEDRMPWLLALHSRIREVCS
jgi:gluconokinase